MHLKRYVIALICTDVVLYLNGLTKKMIQWKDYEEKQQQNLVKSYDCNLIKRISLVLDVGSSSKRVKRSELLGELRKMGGKEQTSEKDE
jgi:hypothetical protein